MTTYRSLAWTAIFVCILVFRKWRGVVLDILGAQRPFRVVLKLFAGLSKLFSCTFGKAILFNPFGVFTAFWLARLRLIFVFCKDENLNVFILDCLTLFLCLLTCEQYLSQHFLVLNDFFVTDLRTWFDSFSQFSLWWTVNLKKVLN